MATINITIPNWLDKVCAWPLMVYRKHKYGYDFRRIYLGEGEWTILDPQDYYLFGDLKWTISGNSKRFYATRFLKIAPGKTKTLRLHREIMNAPKGLLVDHINSDTLDNRRANLRLATHSQNSCNRRIKSKGSSRFRGVQFRKNRGWVAVTYKNKKMIWLGTFDSEIDAARAYDRAAIKYHKEFARLNFAREDYANEISAANSK